MPNTTLYEMDKANSIRLTRKQHQELEAQIYWATTEHRETEIRVDGRYVLLLVSPADDLGHVYKIGPKGGVKDIGVTESNKFA